LNPFFLDYEYNLPNFPADPFGFTTPDRLYWGQISLNYLVNDQGSATLEISNSPMVRLFTMNVN